VGLVTVATNVIAVHPSVPANNLREFIAYAKANPDKLNYASQGNGSVSHIGTEIFKMQTGAHMTHVPYKGVAQVIPDLIGGQIDMAFLPLAGPIPATMLDGKIKGLAVTSKTPHPMFKQLTPLASLPGLSGMEFDLWAGIEVPRDTPDEAVNKLNKAFYAALQVPETRKAMEDTGNTVLPPKSVAELDAIYKSEIER